MSIVSRSKSAIARAMLPRVARFMAANTAKGEAATSAAVRRRPVGGVGTQIRLGDIPSQDINGDIQSLDWYPIAAAMMNDPHVRQSVEYIIAPLIAANWRFKPVSSDPIDQEIAAFQTHAWFECIRWNWHTRRIVRGYCRDGVHVVEPTEKQKEISRDRYPHHLGKGYGVVPSYLHERPANTITGYHQREDNHEQVKKITQSIIGSDVEKQNVSKSVPGSRLLRFSWDQDGANFRGIPILRSAYGIWKIKIALQTILAIKHDRYGIGIPITTLPEGASAQDIANAQQVLAEWRAHERSYIINPPGWETRIEDGGAGGTDLLSAIQQANIDIAINIAAGFMNLGLSNTGGSRAVGGTQAGQHHLQMVGHAKLYTEAWNIGPDAWSPIQRLTELNYGPGIPSPQLECRNLPTRNWLDVIKMANQSAQVGVLTADDKLEDDVRSILEFGPADKSTARNKTAMPIEQEPEEETEDADAHD